MSDLPEYYDYRRERSTPTTSLSQLRQLGPVVDGRQGSRRDMEAVRLIDHRYPAISMHDVPMEFDHDLPHESFNIINSMPTDYGDEWETSSFTVPVRGRKFFDAEEIAYTPKSSKLKPYNDLMMSDFKPTKKSTKEQRKAKTAILTPLFIQLNEYFKERGTQMTRILILGSGSGADIQRVWVAKGKSSENTLIDCVESDPYYKDRDQGFRILANNMPGSTHIMEFTDYEPPYAYDLIIATNSIHYACKDKSGLLIEKVFAKIKKIMAPNGLTLGIMPSKAGFFTSGPGLWDGQGAGMYADNLKTISWYPEAGRFGMLHNITVGTERFDYVLPSDAMVKMCHSENMTCSIMHARSIFQKYAQVVQKRWSYFRTYPEHRGFVTFRIIHNKIAEFSRLISEPIKVFPPVQPTLPEKIRDWKPIDQVKPEQCMVFPRNHGIHIKRYECQYLTRTDSWFLGQKLDGVSGYALVLPNLTMICLDTGEKELYPGSKLEVVLHLQIEKVEDKFWVVELLAVNEHTPDSWIQGQRILRYMAEGWNMPWLGLKEWVKLTKDNIIKWMDPTIPNIDGLVFQNGTSPPPRKTSTEIGKSYYFKNALPFRITYDIMITVIPMLSIGENMEVLSEVRRITKPTMIGVQASDQTGTYEVYEEKGILHRVRYRPEKKPNSDETINNLRDAASLELVFTALEARNVSKQTMYLNLRDADAWMINPLYLWTDKQRVALASTYPASFQFVDYEEPHNEQILRNIYQMRIDFVSMLIAGSYDDLLTSL